ncbi:MAG: polysaccharide deacetylase family protein [Ahrensia sp.]|nr:polysaccharide deacetylase family protein [Ahrensia sp.]
MRLALSAIGGSGLDRLYERLAGECGVILTLHHVSTLAEPEFSPNKHLSVHPEFLAAAIKHLRDRGFDFVAMDDVRERIANPVEGRKFAAVTVDDGYRDFAEFGTPVLRAMDVPYTVYVATGLVDGTGVMWWRGIEKIVRDQSSIEIDGHEASFTFDCETISQKRNALCHLEHHLMTGVPEADVADTVRAWCEKYDIDIDAATRDAVMSWDELRTLAADPLCTIGAHGNDHLALARLSQQAMEADLLDGLDRLTKKMGKRPAHLAYPFGYRSAAGAREFKASNAMGFETAVTTRPGMIFPAHIDHLTALPRISVNGWYQDLRYIAPLASGLPTRLRRRFRQLDVA